MLGVDDVCPALGAVEIERLVLSVAAVVARVEVRQGSIVVVRHDEFVGDGVMGWQCGAQEVVPALMVGGGAELGRLWPKQLILRNRDQARADPAELLGQGGGTEYHAGIDER